MTTDKQQCIAVVRRVREDLQILISDQHTEIEKVRHKLVQALLVITTTERRLASVKTGEVISEAKK